MNIQVNYVILAHKNVSLILIHIMDTFVIDNFIKIYLK